MIAKIDTADDDVRNDLMNKCFEVCEKSVLIFMI